MSDTESAVTIDSTSQTPIMIGRERQAALEQIQEALYAKDDAFKLVLIRAEGGMGKTRLLQEILKNVGHPDYVQGDTAESQSKTIVSDIIDMKDVRLHDSYRCVNAIRQSFRVYSPLVKFENYDEKDRVERAAAVSAIPDSMKEAKRVALEAFRQDLEEITDNRRVTIILDTVEELGYAGVEWLFGDGSNKSQLTDNEMYAPLLDRHEVLDGRTWLWLDRLIATQPDKVTIILAGRPDGGYFGQQWAAYRAIADGKTNDDVVMKDLKSLRLSEVPTFFNSLANDKLDLFATLTALGESSKASQAQKLTEDYRILADPDKDHHRVIGLYTAGLPINLYLYAQLIAMGIEIPSELKKSFAEACEDANIDANAVLNGDKPLGEFETKELQDIRQQVEFAFVDLLFEQTLAKEPEHRLRSNVLLALVRSPRGLTAEQLHYLLDSNGEPPEEWDRSYKSREYVDSLDKYLQILKELEQSYLGKSRSSWDDLRQALPEKLPETSTYRVGLQDEIYALFTRYRKYSETTRQDEIEARRDQYRLLADWSDYQHRSFLKLKQTYLEQDLQELEQRIRLDNPNTYEFPFLGEREARRRAAINTAVDLFDIEYMVYRMLLRPEERTGFNNMSLEDNRAIVPLSEEDFWAQAEIWQALKDDNLMDFASLPLREVTEKRDETRYDVVVRVAEQDDVIRWLKRFVLTGQYKKACELGDNLENRLESLILAGVEDKKRRDNIRHSWNHPFSRAERTIWREYARILQGTPSEEPLKKLQEAIVDLQELYKGTVDDPPIVKHPEDELYDIHGFAPNPNGENIPHPGWNRLGWLLSHAYDILGYGHRLRGEYHDAVVAHGKALTVIRPWPYSEMAKGQLATILNNLSRALLEMGQPSEIVCLDGLHSREQLAEVVPLAASYITLARIYDSTGRYEDAARLSAKAIALCGRAGESHRRALAFLQMASSLRHRANRVRNSGQPVAKADTYLSVAEGLIYQARDIFRQREDKVRQIEAQVEKGRLLRDLLWHQSQEQKSHGHRLVPLEDRAREMYLEAQEILEDAAEKAEDASLPQIVLNVQTNLLRVHYFFTALSKDTKPAEEYDSALQDAARRDIRLREDAEKAVIKIYAKLDNDINDKPRYEAHRTALEHLPDPASDDLRNKAWIFRQLSTAEQVRGWLALDRYEASVEYWKEQFPTDRVSVGRDEIPNQLKKRHSALATDEQAKKALAEAFVAYARSFGYGALFAPLSRSAISLQDDLYGRLHRSNRPELNLQHDQLEALQKEASLYRELGPMFKLLDEFLHQFFGLSDDDSNAIEDESDPEV